MAKKAGKNAKKTTAKKATKATGANPIDYSCPECTASAGTVCSNYKGKPCAPPSARNTLAKSGVPMTPHDAPKASKAPEAKPDTRVISRAHNRPRVEVKITDEERALVVRAIEVQSEKTGILPCPIGPMMLLCTLAWAREVLGIVAKGAAAE